jgi:uncharacterized protein YkwD
MRLLVAVVILLVSTACAGTGVPRAAQTRPPASIPPAGTTGVRDFVQLLNEQRGKAGCRLLQWHDGAAGVAVAHSADMQRRNYFSHDTPEGLGPFDRLRAAGVGYAAAAENIGQGPRTGAEALTLWMNSAGHRRNMLNCTYTHHGVAMAGQYWTHVLIAPR